MYLHLGNGTVVREDELIGIFDLDSTTVSKRTREYLKKSELKGQVTSVGYELPKSFAVCAAKRGQNRVFLSQLLTSTLLKRGQNKTDVL